MMSIINLATASADIVGSYLFERLFDNRLAPLVLVSAAFTAFAFVLVPLLSFGGKRQGVAVRDILSASAGHFTLAPQVSRRSGYKRFKKRRAFRYCFGSMG